MGEPSRRTTISAALHRLGLYVEWPYGSHSSVKRHSPLGVRQKVPKGLSDHDKQDSLVWWNQDPYGEAWWWQHHAVGMFVSGRDWETSQGWGKDERSKVQRDPWESDTISCYMPYKMSNYQTIPKDITWTRAIMNGKSHALSNSLKPGDVFYLLSQKR